MTNIALAVEHLVPEAQYRQAQTYQDLQRTWFDPRTVPTEAQLDAAWTDIQAERNQEQTAAAQRILNMAEVVGDKVDTALAVIDADLAALPAATNADVKLIIERHLQREKKEVRALRDAIITLAVALGLMIEEGA